MIFNEHKFTPKQARDHTVGFLFGSEVHVSGFSSLMFLLAMHPDIQEKCAQEILKVFPHNKTFDTDKINELPYLDMVIKEAFRLLPPIPMILRQTLEEFELSPGLVIPKGVNLVINLYLLQRRKDIWGEDAEQFNPDHFLPENVAKRHQYSYLPFSSGPRSCLANKYSISLLKISVVKLIMAYKFSSTMKMEDFRLSSTITLKQCNPIKVSIQKRQIN